GKGMRGHYKRIAPEGAYFSSGAVQSGIEARADGTRHIIVVMVESLGLPRGNAEMQRLLFAEYKNNPAIRARYDLSQGHNPYYVSTTAGEVRELCGRWGDYYDLVDRKDSNCMPARLANRGYATHAMHSFIGSFFERDQWYPNIGFQKTEFGPLLIERGARNCGGVFAGACDRDVPQQMADMLKKATKPTFLYFLTVNTHLPVPPGMNLNNEDCERLSPKLEKAFPQICRQFVMWHDFNNAMVQEIVAKDFPAADILIVGDHMPPYFDRYHRSQFDPAHVPWLYLRHKDATAAKAGDREG
ncbi:MAG: sulfatase-like hydrolase/transferase, partial [Sphingorhabdus sp.]|nr:sulfatase-like hydrolase/transferase [Sphingorhabdus sp.]